MHISHLLLDDANRLQQIDKENAIHTFSLLPKQAEEAWKLSRAISFKFPRTIERVVVAGMGGSALGPHIIRSMYCKDLPVPFEIVNGYNLPGGVNAKTLVLLSSYSGSTEEVLSIAKEAQAKKAMMLGMSTGGVLGKFLKKIGAPSFEFTPEFNPGNRPRMALGYALFGALGLLKNAKILRVADSEIKNAIQVLAASVEKYGLANPFEKNKAKQMAVSLVDAAPIFIGAEHLEGSTHVLTNQTNETGKHFAVWFALPELNHHLMEGLTHPKAIKKNLAAISIRSNLYHPRVQKRVLLTEEVIEKNGIRVISWESDEKTVLNQVVDMLAFGGAMSYYLGVLHHENPSPTPWVDYFKDRLK